MKKATFDKAGRSELHYAARDANLSEVVRLIRIGSDVESADSRGWTPLHFAVQSQLTAPQGHPVETAEALLKAGAKIDSKDEHGNTPLMRAVAVYRGGEGSMIRLLRKWGADPFLKNNYGICALESARMTANYDVAKYFDDLPK